MKYAIVAFALISAVGLSACGKKEYSLTSTEKAVLDNGAREFAERAGGKFISCSGQDSDRVGYSTCTMQDAKQQYLELRCTYAEKGCKLKPPA